MKTRGGAQSGLRGDGAGGRGARSARDEQSRPRGRSTPAGERARRASVEARGRAAGLVVGTAEGEAKTPRTTRSPWSRTPLTSTRSTRTRTGAEAEAEARAMTGRMRGSASLPSARARTWVEGARSPRRVQHRRQCPLQNSPKQPTTAGLARERPGQAPDEREAWARASLAARTRTRGPCARIARTAACPSTSPSS